MALFFFTQLYGLYQIRYDNSQSRLDNSHFKSDISQIDPFNSQPIK